MLQSKENYRSNLCKYVLIEMYVIIVVTSVIIYIHSVNQLHIIFTSLLFRLLSFGTDFVDIIIFVH